MHALLVENMLLLRFVKLVAVAAFVTGSLGSLLVKDPRSRELLALRLSPAGFIATWASGALYAWAQGRPLFTSWILLAAVFSFLVVTASVALATSGAPARLPARLVIAALVLGSIAAMVWKP